MGLLGNKNRIVTCEICGYKMVHKHEQNQAKDGVICKECYAAAGFPSSISVSLVPLSLLKEQIDSTDGLTIAKRFKEGGGDIPELNISAVLEAGSTLPKREYVAASSTSPIVHCPKCNSESISADKKGFGVGKAVVGAAVAGPIGLVAGNIGASKVRITCLKCGHQWMAGK